MEYRMVQHVMSGHDFFEGVRAGKYELIDLLNKRKFLSVLVDKDNKPQWKPNALKNVSEKEIEHYFEKASSNEDLQL
jgi:enoyl-CoA hydratase